MMKASLDATEAPTGFESVYTTLLAAPDGPERVKLEADSGDYSDLLFFNLNMVTLAMVDLVMVTLVMLW